MTRFGYTLTILLGASLGVAACTQSLDDGTNEEIPPGATNGSDGSTFDHDNNYISVWELIDRLAKEGPPSFTSHMHPCNKIPYQTLGNILTNVGVNTANATALSAGALYRDGATSMGAPSYANRIRENAEITTSGISRAMDIWAAAAPEIITANPTLFNGTTCVQDQITRLIGVPATTAHVELCNLTIQRATTPDVGKRLAVAVIMAAAYTCQ